MAATSGAMTILRVIVEIKIHLAGVAAEAYSTVPAETWVADKQEDVTFVTDGTASSQTRSFDGPGLLRFITVKKLIAAATQTQVCTVFEWKHRRRG